MKSASPIHLTKAMSAWETPEFETVLKQEIEQMDASCLPLQQGLSSSSYVTDRPFQAMIISVNATGEQIGVKAGIFYTGIIAGCNCADDPTPVDEINEYCVVQLDIDRATSRTRVTLLQE
jgi:hypothetical protein